MLGKVTLVGAGPGDPDLITIKGLSALKDADVVIYDHLVSEELLKYAPNSKLIYVGKQKGNHSLTQDSINELLFVEATKGSKVVRLKGGDSFVFGRGSEEASFLRRRGISVNIIPGVSSAIAGAESIGVPVTHRGIADSFRVITAHEGETHAQGETLVIMMGLSNLNDSVAKLLTEGKPATTPIAVISRATTPDERSVCGTLSDICTKVESAALPSPAVVIVGETVKLMPRKVLVARIGTSESQLAKILRGRGEVVEEITVGHIQSFGNIPSTAELRTYTHILFTSRHAAVSVEGVATYGPGSYQTIMRQLKVDASNSVLYLKGKNTPDRFAQLSTICKYHALDVYDNIPVPITHTINLSDYKAVFFTCASSATRLLAKSQGNTQIFCIGEECLNAVKEAGFDGVIARSPNLESLADLLTAS